MASPLMLVICLKSRPVGLTRQTWELILPFFSTKQSVERKKEPLPVSTSSRSAQNLSATSGKSLLLTLGYSLPKSLAPPLVSKARICTVRVPPLSPEGQMVVTTISLPASWKRLKSAAGGSTPASTVPPRTVLGSVRRMKGRKLRLSLTSFCRVAPICLASALGAVRGAASPRLTTF